MNKIEGVIIEKEKILLVEGIDEVNVFKKLMVMINLPDIQVIPMEGKGEFPDKYETIFTSPEARIVKSVGIVRDADSDPKAEFDRIKTGLKRMGHPMPKGLNQAANDGKISINIFLMPDCKSNGALETLFEESIKGTPIFEECITNYLDCVKAKTGCNFNDKTKTYAYIAVQKDPDVRLGNSVEIGHWDLSHACFNPIKNFLREL